MAVAATVEAFGGLDVLANNAGIVDSGPIDTFSEAQWDRIFAVNTKGIFLMSQAALPALRASKNAAIINTASIAGKQGYARMSAYCGSKFAAIGITQPIVPGLMPVTNYAQVRRIASLCKARLPDEFTRAFEAAGTDEAAQFEAGVEFASRQVQGLLDGGVPGIHFYVLNKSTATSRVLRQVAVRER